MMHRVPAAALHLHARHDRLVIVHELENAGVGQGAEVVLPIARAVPLVGMGRILPFAAAHHVARAREPGSQLAAGVPFSEPARMVEVEVRRQDDVDVGGGQSGLGKRVVQVPRSLHTVDVAELLVLLVAQARVDEERPHASDEEGAHGQRDAIPIVGGHLGRPQGLRHNTKHGAAVETEGTVIERHELEVPERMAGDPREGGRIVGGSSGDA